MMSEERFFSQVKTTLEHYAPAVPQEVYAGMRRKLWWSGFTKLSATRFNMWYLLLLVGIGSSAIAYQYSGNSAASKGFSSPIIPDIKHNIQVDVAPQDDPAGATHVTSCTDKNTGTASSKKAAVMPNTANTDSPAPSETANADAAESAPVMTSTEIQDNTVKEKEETPTVQQQKKGRALNATIYVDKQQKDSTDIEN